MGGVGFSRQHGTTVDRFVAITFERSNANDFFFVPEGCYQVFLLKKRFFKLDLVYIHTYIYISSSVFIVLLTGLIKVVLTFDSSVIKFAHAICSCAGSSVLNIMCAQHMSRRDLNELTDSALTTCTGRLFHALTTRIEKNTNPSCCQV